MRVGVVFPGQGSQVVGMGVDVARAYPGRRDVLQQSEDDPGVRLARAVRAFVG